MIRFSRISEIVLFCRYILTTAERTENKENITVKYGPTRVLDGIITFTTNHFKAHTTSSKTKSLLRVSLSWMKENFICAKCSMTLKSPHTYIAHELCKHRIMECECGSCMYKDTYDGSFNHLQASKMCKSALTIPLTLLSAATMLIIPQAYEAELADLKLLQESDKDPVVVKDLCLKYLPHVNLDVTEINDLNEIPLKYSIKNDKNRN